ncbi:cytadherence protein MgpC, partial [Mycoplasmoides pneumoniae]|uniref:cytadherence protein MgpC n=1 Tax=Mycoplasmoides pneumoniae TaxID=2104 RepID=UPI0006BA492E
AVTGFKLDKGRAYRKLNESWPVYEPLDSTKEGKGKDESSWKNSEKTTAENDAPLVGMVGSGAAGSASSLQGNGSNSSGLKSLLRSAPVSVPPSSTSNQTLSLSNPAPVGPQAVVSQPAGGATAAVSVNRTASDTSTFSKYLNTAQALHQMGVIVPGLEKWGGNNGTGVVASRQDATSTNLSHAAGASQTGLGTGSPREPALTATSQRAVTVVAGPLRAGNSSETDALPNVITQLYHTSTAQLAYLNGQIVVMSSDRVPSLWYWVVGEDQESGKATWWAKTELNWGTDKQKQFVENQLGFKDDSNSDSKNSNLKAQGLTQPAYLIAGLDVVADHLVFAAFKAGAVGYDMTTDSSASTYNQALAWSTTAGLDSDGGYKALVENTAGLNGPINGLFTLLDTFAYVTPVSGMKGGSQNNEEVQTTYPVKSDQKATAKIASLINASPLNSYGDDGVTVFDALGLNFNFKLNEERLPSRTDQLLVYGIVNESELKSARENAQSTSDDNSNTKVKWTNTASHYLPVPYYYSANFPEAGNRRRAEQRNGVKISTLESQATDGFANSLLNFGTGLKAGVDPAPVARGHKPNYSAVLLVRGGVVRLNFNPDTDKLLDSTDKNSEPISFSYTPFGSAESAVDLTTLKDVTYIAESGLWFYTFDNGEKPTYDGKQQQVKNRKGYAVITVSRTGIEFNEDANTTTLSQAPAALAVQNGIASSQDDLTGILPLSDEFSAVITKDQTWTGKVDIYKNTNGLFEKDDQLSENVKRRDNGLVPIYNEGIVDIWGRVDFAANSVLQARNLTDKTVDEVINNPDILQSFFKFTPAFDNQRAMLVGEKTSDTTLTVKPKIEYLDGNFYGEDSKIAGIPLNIDFPSRIFAGFAALPSWVIPVSVGSSVGILLILLILGLGIGIPMYKVRKLQDSSFVDVFKKVDTLTTAVGSVYKKIITQTSVIKKAPSALKAANNAAPKAPVKPAAPTAPRPPVQPPKKA